MTTVARKIPGHCPLCANALSRTDMDRFLRICEGWGRDPVEVAFSRTPPGVVCDHCFARAVTDGVEAGEPVAELVLRKMRYYCLGIEELPDGKPIRWH